MNDPALVCGKGRRGCALYPSWLWFVCFALVGCGNPEKQPPIDLDAASQPAPSDFSAEDTLRDRQAEIADAYAAGKDGHFDGVAGVSIHYRAFPVEGELGAIVFVPGRTEPIRKHAETFLDLNSLGYSVYAIDPRGQGESERMLDNSDIGYVEYFSDYVADLETFVTKVVQARAPHEHLFLMAHSMGGAISLMHVYKHPGRFDAVALSSPMIGVDTGAFPAGIAADLAITSCSAGNGEAYAPGQGDYEAEPFEGNDVSHSKVRYSLKQELYAAHPAIRLGGVSYRWLCEAFTADSHLVELGDESDTPTLILEAGSDDVVLEDSEEHYCDAAPRCQRIVYPSAFHEIFSERDGIRNHALSRLVRFFDHFAKEQR
jgi:lysophospholipase